MLVMSEIEARRLLGVQSTSKANPTSDAKNKKVQERKLRSEVFAQLVGLPTPVSEYVFHPTRKWRLDFAWPEYRLALEIHGGVYSGGRHTRGAGFTEDREKMNEAALLGWTVIEATAEQVRSGKLREWVERALQRRRIGG